MTRRWSIKMTHEQLVYGACEGTKRMIAAIEKGLSEAYGSGRNYAAWGKHIEGALAEFAFVLCARRDARVDLKWNGTVGLVSGPDVRGTNFEIKSAAPGLKLIVHHDTPNEKIMWFVTGEFGEYEVKGWIPCADAKQERWWSDPQGTERWAYFVPAFALKAPDSFPWESVRPESIEGESDAA